MGDTEYLKRAFNTSIPFAVRTGIDATSFEKDNITLKMPLEPNMNHIGTMYAGALFTLGEMMGGAVAMIYFIENKLIPIVKGLNIKFLKMAKTDITTTYAMRDEEVRTVIDDCRKNGKAEYAVNLELKDENGVVVAVTEGFYQVRSSW
jgi:thioesterase domain-containing protein